MYYQVINSVKALGPNDAQSLIIELDLLRAEITDIRTKFGTLLAKLDADAGVTDANYASTPALAAFQFLPTTRV